MPKAIMQLTFRQIFNASSATDFEKNVWYFSYEEYKMKSQAYSAAASITTFSVLK